MKTLLTLSTVLLLTVALTGSAFAKKSKGGTSTAKIAQMYDTNHNGMIDGDEVTALRKAFDGGSEDVKMLDTDKDGKLSDGEISAVHGGKKKKK